MQPALAWARVRFTPTQAAAEPNGIPDVPKGKLQAYLADAPASGAAAASTERRAFGTTFINGSNNASTNNNNNHNNTNNILAAAATAAVSTQQQQFISSSQSSKKAVKSTIINSNYSNYSSNNKATQNTENIENAEQDIYVQQQQQLSGGQKLDFELGGGQGEPHPVHWQATLLRETLYLHMPTQLLLNISKEAFVKLLEYAEDQLDCQTVVLSIDRNRIEQNNNLMRMFMYFGFTILPPGHPLCLRGESDSKFYMAYTIQ